MSVIDNKRSDRILTFQDFEQSSDPAAFIQEAIDVHTSGRTWKVAMDADLYDRQMNKTICEFVKKIYALDGSKINDVTASNNRIASNFFSRLNTQRCMYSLGNGVSFVDSSSDPTLSDGRDSTKDKMGAHFDHDLQDAAYKALIHGVSFCFWNLDRMHVFPVTEFVPLWDEFDGTLRAGIRFWRLTPSRPMIAVLYEEDGYTRFRTDSGDSGFVLEAPKKPYITKVQYVPADGVEEVVGTENYSSLPIVPMWGSRLKQSTLIGMRQSIDSYDLIRSGFANDLTDCAQIYWIVENAGGMTDEDLARFRDRIMLNHIANADTSQGGKVTPYVQEIPYQARKQYLDDIRAGIYEDFGGLDVHTVAAGATNDHIDAAYQPLDENADDFEFQITEAVQQILALQGIEDTPVFKRNRISNQKEQVEMVVAEAQWLDQETILRKLPNITPEEVAEILARVDAEDQERMGNLMGAAAMTMGVDPTASTSTEEIVVDEEDE
jgi:hypothetical protein